MIQIGLLIMILLLNYSCRDKSAKDNVSNRDEKSVIEKTIKEELSKTADTLVINEPKDSLTKPVVEPDYRQKVLDSGLSEEFSKAIKCFPKDSSSLYRFYIKRTSIKDQERLNKQKRRLNELTSKESVKKYKTIESYLKPLMIDIVKSNTITKAQSYSLVELYSNYDNFKGESLFSSLLTNDENYSLVWKSLKIMVNESSKDTCFISGLIKLNKNVRTNIELAEGLEDFKVKAIINNPLGFLDMYNLRQGKQRNSFAYNITVWDDPTKEIMDLLTIISNNSTDENYKKIATELIDKFKVE
ncbi:hypothetical protein [Labilibacter marinus]|uniref:hypothetical protein n=1 Tax=Labilibacter marinus TaxID=1477105 RepID=UPI0009502939|nr:hypothetical protein [Labilibacter marinus]